MTDETIPDWARVEAVKRLNAEYNVRGVEGIHHKTPRDDKNVNIVVLARLIAKHEQPPEDPDLATAREVVERWACVYQPVWGGFERRDTQIALAAIKLHKERNP